MTESPTDARYVAIRRAFLAGQLTGCEKWMLLGHFWRYWL